MHSKTTAVFAMTMLTLGFAATAADDLVEARDKLMNDEVRGPAKPIGAMLRGKADFDQALLLESLGTMSKAAEKFGEMFPDGSEGGRAATAIWEDREGFDAAMKQWQDAVAAAIAASPASLDEAKPVAGPVFNACKNCHDSYRIEED